MPLDEEVVPVPLGKAEELRPGKDILILAVGNMVSAAVEAAASLAGEGIEAGVINARFVKPLDEKLILERAAGTNLVLCVEENNIVGGFRIGCL